jgi:hypothetical protein
MSRMANPVQRTTVRMLAEEEEEEAEAGETTTAALAAKDLAGAQMIQTTQKTESISARVVVRI